MQSSKWMKRAFAAAALGLAAHVPGWAADVGVSISVSQPGVYGRVDIGNFPQPQVVVAQPVWGLPAPRVVVRPEPVYMWVPPGHRRDWPRYCSRYNACGVPVYFVQEQWYREHVWRGDGRPGEWRDERRDERRGDYRRDDRGDYRGDYGGDRRGGDRDDDRGHGRGRGHGHDH